MDEGSSVTVNEFREGKGRSVGFAVYDWNKREKENIQLSEKETK